MTYLYLSLISFFTSSVFGLSLVWAQMREMLTPSQNWTLLSIIGVIAVGTVGVLIPLCWKSMTKQASTFAESTQKLTAEFSIVVRELSATYVKIAEEDRKAFTQFAKSVDVSLDKFSDKINDTLLDVTRKCTEKQNRDSN